MIALVVAVVGALGALLTALLAHRAAARSKQAELELAEAQRRAELERGSARESLEVRRAWNALLNQSVRRYHDALSGCLTARGGAAEAAARRQELDDARRSHRDTYAAAQMVISDAVLVPAAELIGRLNRVYSLLTPADGEPPSGEQRSAAETELAGCSDELYALRQLMRADLGITALPPHRPQRPRTRFSTGGGGSSAGQ
ncbi:hypothetical protein [Streptomyces sp. RKAG293]|uniref:hypothetical protein n=1 Tax=Streptomyces sp. RKAG293 TaxID=2893403 RepID=UPI002034A127|nr:hypothetical protein [Streptomyces sp. RKAG293]MCM2421840.1 hypothetical protein [Streptomyces sp. RKAG293]